MKAEALREWRRLRRRRRLAIAALGIVGLVVIAVAILSALLQPNAGTVAGGTTTRLPKASPPLPPNLPPPDLLRPIAPEEAIAENAKRAFSGRPDTPAAGFMLKTDANNHARALECLTQAVYYEAAAQGADGQRAVAQIVLNRMRHPGYPATVCGVVYQGSERRTGCQFTFTCDGSLARVPQSSLWKQARKVAGEALAGKVFAPVGHATHYHANYVLPFWADSLDKSIQIGRHIFYRLKGTYGSPAAFSQRYRGPEPEPPAPSTVQVSLEAVAAGEPLLIAPTKDSGLAAPAGELVAPVARPPDLLADAVEGTLLIDGDAPRAAGSTRRPQPRNDEACTAGTDGKQLRPISANDVRAQGAKPGC